MAPPNAFTVHARGGIVRVWYARSARTVEEAQVIVRAIDEALERTGIHLLLIDSRDADRTPEDVQGYIWSWLSGHRDLRRVATVMKSVTLASNVRAIGRDRGIRIRTFPDVGEAERWLVSL